MIKLDDDTNYIVSGLERSGTSLMMQILKASGYPVVYDNKRKPDKNNPKGYFELEGGKIISALRNKKIDLDKYKGKFIKITSWGLQYLPKGKYEIIYMVRNIDEIVESTLKMSKNLQAFNRMELRKCLLAFDMQCISKLDRKTSDDFGYVVIYYNALLNPSTREEELSIIACRNYGNYDIVEKGKEAIDVTLYRNK